MYRITLVVASLTLIVTFACSERAEFPSGYELLDRKSKGEVKQITVYPVAAGEKQYRTEVNAGTRDNLFLGEYKEYQAWSVLRFVILPDSPTVTSAQLVLTSLSLQGAGEPFRATVHPVTKEWQEASVIWSDLIDGFDTEEIGAVDVPPSDTTDLIIDINPQIINAWIAATTSNYGILLKYANAGFLREFGSSDNADSKTWPYLKLLYTIGGKIDSTNAMAGYDATLFKYTGSELPERLIFGNPYLKIGNASGFRTLLRFDLSKIPSQATIHRGLLELFINSDFSETIVEGMNYGIYQIVSDSLWEPNSIKTDSTTKIPIGLVTSDNEILGKLDISYASAFATIIQNWVLGKSPNYGMMIRSVELGKNTSYLAFYTTAQQDSSLMPRLTITYSLPPSPRFEE